jgi:cytoskeletal protein RodZ
MSKVGLTSGQPAVAEYAEFGNYLRAKRESAALTIADLSRKTKISPALLEALEQGLAQRLPERIFILNYLKSYAMQVGLPPDEVLERFAQIPGAPSAEVFDPKELERARRGPALIAMRVFIALALAAAALWLGPLVLEHWQRLGNS